MSLLKSGFSEWFLSYIFVHRRIQLSQDLQYFATASDDGSVKLWDLQKLDGNSLINKSRQTYSRQGMELVDLYCTSPAWCFAPPHTTVVMGSMPDPPSDHVGRVYWFYPVHSSKYFLLCDKN